jgi:hypothetical protein
MPPIQELQLFSSDMQHELRTASMLSSGFRKKATRTVPKHAAQRPKSMCANLIITTIFATTTIVVECSTIATSTPSALAQAQVQATAPQCVNFILNGIV